VIFANSSVALRAARNIMTQNKAYRAAEPEDLAILLLSVGEIGTMAMSAAQVLVLVWPTSGSI
jgi:hypothetical protein